MKRFIMEYIENGRTQQVLYADNIKKARKAAKTIAELRGITEYYVYAG